jgi:hypothetical protein
MDIYEQTQFNAFERAKRQITDALEHRIEALEETRGDVVYIIKREAKIEELERIRSFIRNSVLYKDPTK